MLTRHLPGKENVLSDGISRLSGRPDPSDWMLSLSPAVFHALRNLYGPFEVDACCDALGNNSLCSVFWSALDSDEVLGWEGGVVPVVQDEYRYCMGTALCSTDLYWYSY